MGEKPPRGCEIYQPHDWSDQLESRLLSPKTRNGYRPVGVKRTWPVKWPARRESGSHQVEGAVLTGETNVESYSQNVPRDFEVSECETETARLVRAQSSLGEPHSESGTW